MGNSNSSDPVVNLLKKVVDENTNSSVCSEVSVTGGNDMLNEYKITESSAARNIIIKKLAYGISRALSTEPPNENASPDEMIAHLMRIIPNPRLGKSIAARENIQIDVCERMADVVNEGYGNIIDKTIGPIGIVNQISDVINSLSAGIHKEFISISASVSIALSNLNTIRDMLDRSYTKLNNTIIKNGDANSVRKANSLSGMHKIIMDEFARQIAMLSNLTHSVLRPVDSDIVKILKSNKDFEGLVARIKSRVGTSEWGDRIGFWLSGMGGVAQMALRVDTALKDIGMSLSAYKESRNIEDLVMNVHSALESVPKSNMTKEYLEKYTDAINTLKKFHNSHDIIADHLTKNAESKIGGAVMPLTKKINSQLKTRIVLLEDFKMKSNILISRVYDAIVRLSGLLNIGEIPITSELTHFKNLLKDLANIFSEGSEYALTGYYTHANAVTHKERFVDILNSMLVYANTLAPLNNIFSELGRNIGDLLKLIDFYNDKFHIHTSNVLSTKTGGGAVYKSVATLKNAKNILINAYSVSKMRDNLRYAAANREEYNKKYNEIVGTSIAQVIDDYSTQIDGKINFLKGESSYGDAEKDNTDIHHHLFKSGDWSKASVLAKLEYERDTKIELFRYCQIIDRELLEYADDVAANPSLIQEISRMLESVDIVSNWFNDEKGNLLATYFEVLTPNYDICTVDVRDAIYGDTTDVNDLKTKLTNSTDHYYKYLENSNFAQYHLVIDNGTPVLPQVQANYNNAIIPYIANLNSAIWGESPDRELLGLHFNKHIRDKSYALKNIVSIYTSLCPNKSNTIGYNAKSLYNTLSSSYGGKVVGNKNSLKSKSARKKKRLELVKGGAPYTEIALNKMEHENAEFNGEDCEETTKILNNRMTSLRTINNELKSIITDGKHSVPGIMKYIQHPLHMNGSNHLYSGIRNVSDRLLEASYISTSDLFEPVRVKIDPMNNSENNIYIPNCGDTILDNKHNKQITKGLFTTYERIMNTILKKHYIDVDMSQADKEPYSGYIPLKVNITKEEAKDREWLTATSVLPFTYIPTLIGEHFAAEPNLNPNSIFKHLTYVAFFSSLLVNGMDDGKLWYADKFGNIEDVIHNKYYKYDKGTKSIYAGLLKSKYIQSQPTIRIIATMSYKHDVGYTIEEAHRIIEKIYNEEAKSMTPLIIGMAKDPYIAPDRIDAHFKNAMDNLTDLILLYRLLILHTNKNIVERSRDTLNYLSWSLMDILARMYREVKIIKNCWTLREPEYKNITLYYVDEDDNRYLIQNDTLLSTISSQTEFYYTDMQDRVSGYTNAVNSKYPIEPITIFTDTHVKTSNSHVKTSNADDGNGNYTLPESTVEVPKNRGVYKRPAFSGTSGDNNSRKNKKPLSNSTSQQNISSMKPVSSYTDNRISTKLQPKRYDRPPQSRGDDRPPQSRGYDRHHKTRNNVVRGNYEDTVYDYGSEDEEIVGGAIVDIYNNAKTDIKERIVGTGTFTDKFMENIDVHIVKAMVAKILSATGLYNMLQYNKSFALTHRTPLDPVRLILGGDPYSGTPEIYPEILCLYVRLPLLVEFYRDLFCFDTQCDDDTYDSKVDGYLISMAPEVGSVWADLIQTIFEQSLTTSQTGTYSDNTVKRIIHCINRVYQSFKANYTKPDLNTHIIENFVSEVNNRYGVMRRSEIVKYINDKRSRDNSMTYGNSNEKEYGFYLKPVNNSFTVPSDRYSGTVTSISTRDDTFELYKAVNTFLNRIEKRMENINVPHIDIEKICILTTDSLKKTMDKEKRYKEAKSAMFDMERHDEARTDINIMFHETILTPLAVLTKITRILMKFRDIISIRDIKTARLIADYDIMVRERNIINTTYTLNIAAAELKKIIKFYIGYVIINTPVGLRVNINGIANPYNIPPIAIALPVAPAHTIQCAYLFQNWVATQPAAIITQLETTVLTTDVYKNLVKMIDTSNKIYDGGFNINIVFPEDTNITINGVTQRIPFYRDGANSMLDISIFHIGCYIYHEIVYFMNIYAEKNNADVVFGKIEKKYDEYKKNTGLTDTKEAEIVTTTISTVNTELAPISRDARYNSFASLAYNYQDLSDSYKRAYSREHFGFPGDDSKEPITWFSHWNSQRIKYENVTREVTRAIMSINYDLGSLCDIQISIDKHINVDFSGLHRVCNEVFAGVKKYFGLFRNRVDNNIMQRMDVSSDFVGSISWIQHNLFDSLFGRKITYKDTSLGYINKIINDNIEQTVNIKKTISYINGIYDVNIPNSVDCNRLFLKAHNKWHSLTIANKATLRNSWANGLAPILQASTPRLNMLQSKVAQYNEYRYEYLSTAHVIGGGVAFAPAILAIGGDITTTLQRLTDTSFYIEASVIPQIMIDSYYRMIILFLCLTGRPGEVMARLVEYLLGARGYNCSIINTIRTSMDAEVADFNRSTVYKHMPNPFKLVTKAMEKLMFPKNSMGCSIERSIRALIYDVEPFDAMSNASTMNLTFGELFKDWDETTRSKQLFLQWELRLPLYYNPKDNIGRIGFKSDENMEVGILLRFNELVSQYMSKFWDTSVNKIYAPLIEVPANGPLRSSVFKNTGFPDMAKVHFSTPGNSAQTAYLNPNIIPPGGNDNALAWYLGLQANTRDRYKQVMHSIYNHNKPHIFDVVSLFVFFFSNTQAIFTDWDEAGDYTLMSNPNGTLPRAYLDGYWSCVIFRYTYMLNHRMIMTALEYFRTYTEYSLITGSIPALLKTINQAYTETASQSLEKYCRFMAKAIPDFLNWSTCYSDLYETLNFDRALTTVKKRIDAVYDIISNTPGTPVNMIIRLAGTLKFPAASPFMLGLNTDLYYDRDREFTNLFTSLNDWLGTPSTAVYTVVNPGVWHPLVYIRIWADALLDAGNPINMSMYVPNAMYHEQYVNDILYTSLSRSIFKALTYTDNKNVKPYIIQSLSEVPLRIKEEMKAYLPVFSNLFRSLSKNASLVKHMCKVYGDMCFEQNHTEMPPFGYTFCHYVNQEEFYTTIDELYTPSGSVQKDLFIGTLDKIIAACLSFSSSIDNIISDLNDTALYMEVGDNSMLKYKNRTNQIPFTPLSSLTYVCKEYNDDAKFGSLVYGSGDYDFMFSYGIRGTIHDYNTIPVFDRMPGIKHILDNYNITSANTSVLEAKTYEYYIKNVIELFRFTYSINIYSFTGGGTIHMLANDMRPEYVAYYENKNKYLPYQMYENVNIAEVVSLTTSEDYTKSSNYISDAVSLINNQSNTRASIALHNIADLEICPIDLHAMRREIPLINIMNYSHACDRMITSIVNRSMGNNSNVTHQTSSPAGMFLRLCRNPYTTIEYDDFRKNFGDLVKKDSPLGKSRYLYNQLWCKVLMQNSSNTDLIDHKNNRYPVGATAVEAFRQTGFTRFNTKIIRDDIFHVLLHKAVLYAINKELTNVIFSVSTGNSVASDLIINRGPEDDDTFLDI